MPSARPRGMMVALWIGSEPIDIQRHDGVAAFVKGGELLFLVAHRHGAAFGAHHHLVLGVFQLAHRDHALAAAGGQQRAFVDQIGEIGAGEAGRAARDDARIDIGRQRHLAQMHAQDLFAAGEVGIGHHDMTVETAGTQQRRIQHVGTVGGGDQDDAFIGFEAVHLDQQLVEGLLALVIAAAQAGAAMAADRVDFVDEDDAGRILLGLLEHVAHAAGADAHEHFDKVRTGNGEEGHIGFAGDGARQQGLAGARRADQQHALGNAAAQALEFLRIAQEVHDFLQIVLGLVHAGDVFKGDAALALGQQLGARLAEAHRLAAARLHLAQEEHPHADQTAAWGTS